MIQKNVQHFINKTSITKKNEEIWKKPHSAELSTVRKFLVKTFFSTYQLGSNHMLHSYLTIFYF